MREYIFEKFSSITAVELNQSYGPLNLLWQHITLLKNFVLLFFNVVCHSSVIQLQLCDVAAFHVSRAWIQETLYNFDL